MSSILIFFPLELRIEYVIMVFPTLYQFPNFHLVLADDNAESLISLKNRGSKALAMCIHISKLLTYSVVVRASSQD